MCWVGWKAIYDPPISMNRIVVNNLRAIGDRLLEDAPTYVDVAMLHDGPALRVDLLCGTVLAELRAELQTQ